MNTRASGSQQLDAQAFKHYLIAERQRLIMALGEVEDLLGMERSITPRRKRRKRQETQPVSRTS